MITQPSGLQAARTFSSSLPESPPTQCVSFKIAARWRDHSADFAIRSQSLEDKSEGVT